MLKTPKTCLADGLTKGFPHNTPPTPLAEIGAKGWNLLRGDAPLPNVILLESALRHNSAWMQKYIAHSGVLFAPHGKTTMAPQLFDRQLKDGAWGITAATIQQAHVYRAHGVNKILLANQLLQRIDVEYVAHELNQHNDFEFLSLIDSVDGCEILARALRDAGINRPLQVLLEVGAQGRRTGCRDLETAIAIAEAVSRHPDVLRLCGVEGFEGIIWVGAHEDSEKLMRAHLDLVMDVAMTLKKRNLFAANPAILTAGGSGHFDLVVDRFVTQQKEPFKVILRSGCYIAHDHGMYRMLQERRMERAPALKMLGAGLRPAMEAWAMVQSRPEPTRAICTIGKRDLGIDVSLPVLAKWFRPGHHDAPQKSGLNGEVVEVNDQHLHIVIPEDSPLKVGDLVCFGISHPCTTFDKWKVLFLVDDAYNIISAMETWF